MAAEVLDAAVVAGLGWQPRKPHRESTMGDDPVLAAIAHLETKFDASVTHLESAHGASIARLETKLDAPIVRLETIHDASIDSLEAKLEVSVARLAAGIDSAR